MKRQVPFVKRAVTRLIHVEREVAQLYAAWEESGNGATGQAYRDRVKDLDKARRNYERQMARIADRLGEGK